jgi:outer membrane protein assembly factor BamB
MENEDFDFTEDQLQEIKTENISLGFSLDMIRTTRVSQGFNVGEGGTIYSDPIIVGERVLFGACDRFLYCLDKKTGKLVWKFRCGGVVNSPIQKDGVVYFGSYDNNVYAVDMGGRLVWKFETRDKAAYKPVVFMDMICVGSKDRHMYALDIRTGRLRWKFETHGRVSAQASVHKDMLLFGSSDKNLYALDRNGRRCWKFATQGHVSVPVVHNGIVYFTSMDHYIYAIRLSDQRLLWRYRAMLSFASMTKATIHGDSAYFPSRDYYLYKLALDGRLQWKFKTSHMTHSNPLVHEGVVYFGSDDDYFYAVDSETGRLLWKYKTQGPVLSDPAMDGGMIYFGSWDCHLYAMTTGGKLVWKFMTSSAVQSGVDVEMRIVSEPMEMVTPEQVEVKIEDNEEERASDYGSFSASYVTSMPDYTGAEEIDVGSLAEIKKYKGLGRKYR